MVARLKAHGLVGRTGGRIRRHLHPDLDRRRRRRPGRRRRARQPRQHRLGMGASASSSAFTSPAEITGGHLNPAVTSRNAVFSGFPWRKVLPYSLAQTARRVRRRADRALELHRGHRRASTRATRSRARASSPRCPATAPDRRVSEWGAFRDQIIGTAILLFLVFAVTDPRNTSPLANMAPVVVGFIVVAIGMAWGTDAGYAINPARDFGPRLASFFTGYGSAFRDQYGNLYFWVPIVGPADRRPPRRLALQGADRAVPARRRADTGGHAVGRADARVRRRQR